MRRDPAMHIGDGGGRGGGHLYPTRRFMILWWEEEQPFLFWKMYINLIKNVQICINFKQQHKCKTKNKMTFLDLVLGELIHGPASVLCNLEVHSGPWTIRWTA